MKLQYDTATLSCGLRVIHATSATNVIYCGYAINAGTRDETEQESGMAHFCEHMMFKGTARRRSMHILNRMENVGGDINAYTNKEETVVYAAFLKEHFARAVDLMTDLVFCSTFPQAEIDKEVEVIADEIQSYKDSPSELIFDDFENLIFPSHPLGRDILGNPDRLRQYQTVDALNFTSRYYRPDNMVFFVYGQVDFKKVVHELEKALANTGYARMDGVGQQLPLRRSPAPYEPQKLTKHKDTHQAHVMIGGRGYDAFDERRIGLYLLNNLLGGPGMNSRLNVSLREKRGLVYTVESNMGSYTDAGVFCIYFGCDTEDTERCIRLVHNELQKLIKTPLSDSQLRAAKRQIIGQIGVACDNFESFALGIGKEYLHYNRCKDIEALNQKIEALTADDLQGFAREIFSDENLSTLIYN